MKHILRVSFVALLTVVFLALFLWKSNLHEVWAIMKATDPGWLTVALLVNFSALVFRTVRWRTILDVNDPPPFYPTFFATTIGYMLSTLLPIRAGDVARPALLARRTKIRFTTALGTVITERILDLAALLVLFLYFVLVHWNDFQGDALERKSYMVIRGGAVGAGLLLLALIAFMFGLYFFQSKVRRLHEWIGKLVPARFRDSWMQMFDSFTSSLELARHPAALMRVLFSTVAIWAALTSQFWFVSLASHRPLPFDFSYFISGLSTLGLAVPTPGGVGGFHKICQLVLTTFYHFDIDSSVAMAVLFHIVGTLPVIVAGLALFLREGMRWRDLRQQAENEP